MLGTDFPVETPANDNPFAPGRPSSNQQNSQPLGVLRSNDQNSEPGSDGARYYTIQRVNGNGANGKGDGTAGSHKHTIEESDKVKKSSIHRYFIKEEKERRKSLVSLMYHSCISVLEPQASFQSSNELHTSTCMCLVRKRSPSSSLEQNLSNDIFVIIAFFVDHLCFPSPVKPFHSYHLKIKSQEKCLTMLTPPRKPTTRKPQALL